LAAAPPPEAPAPSTPAPRRAARVKAATTARPCEPPYVIDDDGYRRMKPACL
jgi:hypothetical protein